MFYWVLSHRAINRAFKGYICKCMNIIALAVSFVPRCYGWWGWAQSRRYEAAPIIILVVHRLVEPLSLCISVQALHVWEMPLPLTCIRCCCLLLPREYGIPCSSQWQIPVSSSSQPNGRNASWSHCYGQGDQWPPVCFFPPKSLRTDRALW